MMENTPNENNEVKATESTQETVAVKPSKKKAKAKRKDKKPLINFKQLFAKMSGIKPGLNACAKVIAVGLKDKRILFSSGGVIVLAVVVSVCVALSGGNSASFNRMAQARKARIGHALTDIQVKLANIEKDMGSSHATINLDSINSQMQAIADSVKSLGISNTRAIEAKIDNNKISIGNKLTALQKAVTSLRKSMKKVTYLSPSHLPFQVVSIDNIQEQNVLTVNYDYRTTPLDIGYSLAGWRLLRASFAKQSAEFINNKKQHVLVQLHDGGF